MNRRELRIAFFYFSLIVLDFFLLLHIRATGFLYLDNSRSYALFSGILIAFLLVAPIPCIAAALYHIAKCLTFGKRLSDRKLYFQWTLSSGDWFNFIRKMLAVNLKDEAKSIIKMSLVLIPVASLTTILFFASAKETISDRLLVIYMALPFLICTAYFLWVAGRNVLKFLDHTIFGNKTITFFKDAVLFNGEWIIWGTSLENELLRAKIRDGCLDIHYTVTSRSKGRHSRLNETDIKRLKIPIPKEKTEEARFLVQRW